MNRPANSLSSTDRAALALLLLAFLVVAHGFFLLRQTSIGNGLLFHALMLGLLTFMAVVFLRRWMSLRREAAWDAGETVQCQSLRIGVNAGGDARTPR
ncbi:hypothetical protein ACO2Q9_06370 [Variovorax sp. VNK109]|jgi:hypothetical protein|uniref:hypothetical protein n=1 Tax=Variovorax sp. VNK109 TaxID=3400919 RepID=UPI003C0C396C